MSAPLSIRFDAAVLSRLRRRVSANPGATVSGLAQRLVDEGLRMAEHPGILFKNGPSGRRAAVAFGPDVWELVKVVREIDERGEKAIEGAAELLTLSPAKVRLSLDYYTAYPDEIDAEIADADQASVTAEEAWISRQRLLA
ncbi:MAG: hypothetical protein ACYDAQ_14935 [Mycobacteriales bacterium]